MFKILKIETEEHLHRLLTKSKEVLQSSIQIVHYPTSLRVNGVISEWSQKYKEIDKSNQKLLDHISQKAGVYTLCTKDRQDHWKILYIGQTQSKTARQRIRSHIIWRNKKTKSGQFTGSKFDEVQGIILSGSKLGFSFVQIHPASLRHYVEENLIKELNPPWNQHGSNNYMA